MHVPQSPDLHTNQADEAFYRVGDKSKKLNFEQRMQLFYAKGKRYFEDAPVFDATIADIDLDLVQAYCKKIGYAKKPEAFYVPTETQRKRAFKFSLLVKNHLAESL